MMMKMESGDINPRRYLYLLGKVKDIDTVKANESYCIDSFIVT